MEGNIASRRFMIFCILITELCERLTFYSITANVVIFMSDNLNFGSPDALVIHGAFIGTCYFIPIFGGLIADSISGRYNTIFGAGLIYVVGTLLLPTAAFGQVFGFEMDLVYRQLFFLIGLCLVAIGTGGIKANVGPFGAQQLEDLGPAAVQSFFRWFYWFINVGSAIAFALVAYVQQNINYFYGYLIPACSMFLAVIVFVMARSNYLNRPPEGSVLSQTSKIVWEAAVKNRNSIYKMNSFMDRAKDSYGGSYSYSQVEDVKSVGRVIPVFLTFIFYWTVSTQMQSTFLLQAERMNLQLGSLVLPAASLSLFNTIIILILVPIMDFLVFPLLEKFNKKPTPLQKIGIGLFLAASSVAVGGILEIYRKEDIAVNGGFPQEVGSQTHNASNLTVLLQVPQFALFGASEVFASITGLEFAFSQAPAELNGVMMGLFLSATGFGSYLGSALVGIVNAASVGNEWLPDEFNDGHADYFFFLLSGVMLLDFFIYLLVAKWYKYVPTKSNDKKYEEEDIDSDLLLKTDADTTTGRYSGYGALKGQDSTEC